MPYSEREKKDSRKNHLHTYPEMKLHPAAVVWRTNILGLDMTHLMWHKREGKGPLTRDNGQCCPTINGVGTEPHTSKDSTTNAGALALVQPYPSQEDWGKTSPNCRALGLMQ